MEDAPIRSLKSRKNEGRSLLKNCFRSKIFSLVPFEIWMFVVNNADVETVVSLWQTCWGFKELVDHVGENNVHLANNFRKEGRVSLALKYLLKCTEKGNSLARFHMGYAYLCDGWGLKRDGKIATDWFKKAAECGNGSGMAMYAYCLRTATKQGEEVDLSNVWGHAALTSTSFFALGSCYYHGLGTSMNLEKAAYYFEISAKDGDEYGQFRFAYCLKYGQGLERDYVKALFWFKKSAEQGLAISQYHMGCMFRDGHGCIKDKEMSALWFEKASNQGHKYALIEVKFNKKNL